MLDDITPLIITCDERDNIERSLGALAWARRIVVLDSGSTDGTVEIARSFPNVEVITRPFDSFAGQCNFGLTRIRTEWVLSIDADYVLTPALSAEIAALRPPSAVAGYQAPFVYCIYGRPLRGSLYPARTVLYRIARANYVDEGHGHRVVVDGTVRSLRARIRHDDRKPLERWFTAQRRYARAEADHLTSAPGGSLSWKDRIRRTGVAAPFLVLAYTLLGTRCLLDGRAGWFYVLQRSVAEAMIALELIDRRLRKPRC